MFRKLLVANRGEIAIRAFRAAYELELATVAVFPYEDRNSLHRAKADESYLIGERGHPVRAYLSVDEVIAAARRAGADAIYPGYGFLSENPDLAQACADAGITFVGPPPEVLHLTGDKSRAIAAAREAGLPVLGSSAPSAEIDELVAAADELGFPLFVKAVAGGGGRGMRRVDEPGQLRESVARPPCARRRPRSATRRCSWSAPWSTRGTSRCRSSPTPPANVVHLYERDCSLQRRHQKVIEIAPAPEPGPGCPRPHLRRRRRVRPPHRLRQRRHGGVPARRARAARVHRDEPAHPGRAHRHRAGHRPRPGDRPAPGRGRHDAVRDGPASRSRSMSTAPRCSAGSPPRTRPTASARTPA